MDQPTHLYRYFDDQNYLLYVGISASAMRRLLEHASGKIWAALVARVDVQTLPSRNAALAAEKEAIVKENPRFNVQHNRPASGVSVTSTSKTRMLATRIPHGLLSDLALLHGKDGPAKTQSEAVVLALTCGIAMLTNKD